MIETLEQFIRENELKSAAALTERIGTFLGLNRISVSALTIQSKLSETEYQTNTGFMTLEQLNRENSKIRLALINLKEELKNSGREIPDFEKLNKAGLTLKGELGKIAAHISNGKSENEVTEEMNEIIDWLIKKCDWIRKNYHSFELEKSLNVKRKKREFAYQVIDGINQLIKSLRKQEAGDKNAVKEIEEPYLFFNFQTYKKQYFLEVLKSFKAQIPERFLQNSAGNTFLKHFDYLISRINITG